MQPQIVRMIAGKSSLSGLNALVAVRGGEDLDVILPSCATDYLEHLLEHGTQVLAVRSGHRARKMKLIALVQDAENIARYLRHLGLPTNVPPMAPANSGAALMAPLLGHHPDDHPRERDILGDREHDDDQH
jgi:hypothetical protein